MSHEATADNPYTRGIAEFVSGLSYDAIPPEVLARIKLLMLDSLGCAIYGADLEWSRILQQRLGELDATQACTVWGTRQRLSAPHAALVNGTQVQGFELDDVHRAGRAARRRGGAAGADRDRRIASRHERQGVPDRGGRRLRDRAARRHLHGPRAHRAGLAFGRDPRRVLRRCRRRARIEARHRQDRARARHRRHPGRGPDGRAIWRDGQAHARRTRVAKRALWRALRRGRLHRHRQRARKRIRRLLHHLLALDRPLQACRAHRGPRHGVADDGGGAQVLLLRRQQPHHARRDPRDAGRSDRSAPTTSPQSSCTARR